ncbi:MAG: hypothetical protein ACI8P3_001993 [Saprospiraceae bacterium]|jgi:hypothetical protein
MPFYSCKSAPEQQSGISGIEGFDFLDSTQAAERIATDQKELFFNYINVLDMSIQLKASFPDSTDREIVLAEYKNSLQTTVMGFSKVDLDFIKKALTNIFATSAFDLKKIINKPIALIKVSGIHYGEGTYYTRENCIIIPANELQNPISSDFEKVIKHELFHIYSRYHPEKRKALYELIGYKSIGDIRHLQMNQRLRSRILLNPDGINYAYAINLQKESKAFQAIPLIIANKEQFDTNQTAFFNYLQFDLYKIQPPFSRLIKVESTIEGESIIHYKEQPEFWTQIGDNTDYIIHPDEVLADNFVLLLNGEASWEELSPRGQELLMAMKRIIFE